jgi:hypothetical protein
VVITRQVTVHRQFAQLDINLDPVPQASMIVNLQVVQRDNIGMVQQHHVQLAPQAVIVQGSAVLRMEHVQQQLEPILAQHQKMVGPLGQKLEIPQ